MRPRARPRAALLASSQSVTKSTLVLRAPESVIDDPNAEQILTTIFSLTTEQTSKIQELGQANFIMTMYDHCMCLQDRKSVV